MARSDRPPRTPRDPRRPAPPDLTELKERLQRGRAPNDGYTITQVPVFRPDPRSPYVPTNTREPEPPGTIEAEVVSVSNGQRTEMRATATTAVAKRSSPARSGLRLVTFMTFGVLGAGVWGWGPFGTLIFALVATAVISDWLFG
jgi:hypothetical protein